VDITQQTNIEIKKSMADVDGRRMVKRQLGDLDPDDDRRTKISKQENRHKMIIISGEVPAN
jgi:hypothetical protein